LVFRMVPCCSKLRRDMHKLEVILTLLVGSALAIFQIYRSTIVVHSHDEGHSREDHVDNNAPRLTITHDDAEENSPQGGSSLFSNKTASISKGFGACLMIKEDNDLLYEWIAYHYTTLPLRHLYIGSDEGNRQDPLEVLSRWDSTDLNYWIFNSSSFAYRHSDGKQESQDAHHQFLHRQRGFITTCAEFMKNQNVTWVLFVDSDEFVVPNPLGNDDEKGPPPSNNESKAALRFQMRSAMAKQRSEGRRLTVVEIINMLSPYEELEPCYTMPRLLFGSLENATCPESEAVDKHARTEFDFDQLSTLRFKQHAKKGDFATGKFAKVFVDVSRIPDEQFPVVPKSIHRPFRPLCGPAVVPFEESLFIVNHYVGSWERYNSREDGRRDCEAWRKRAFVGSARSCEQLLHEWFATFVQEMGRSKSKILLGVEEGQLVVAVPQNATNSSKRDLCPVIAINPN